MSTTFPSSKTVEPQWFLVDATDQVLGRLAARVASLLRGKENPSFTPFFDTGEHVVIVNCAKVKLTGQKLEQKEYHHFTGFPGGLKTRSIRQRMESQPEEIVRDAVEGMLPKNRLGKTLGSKLKVYAGAEHPHAAQTPKPVQLVKARAPRAAAAAR